MTDQSKLRNNKTSFLNNDCCLEMFDWLSIEDLHKFGQTCKRFNKLVNKYFEWKYQCIDTRSKMTTTYYVSRALPGFNEYVTRIFFAENESEKVMLNTWKVCKAVKEMKIDYAFSNQHDISVYEPILCKLEILKIHNATQFTDDYFAQFLKCCLCLKRLKMLTSPGTGWMNNTYSHLTNLEIRNCDESQDIQLIKFLQQHPNIRRFSTSYTILMRNREALINSNIELDDLNIFKLDNVDMSDNVYAELHQRRVYKRLHLSPGSSQRLFVIPGLATLFIESFRDIQMFTLPTVTELVYYGSDSRSTMNAVSMYLKNLQSVHILESDPKYMLPFIRNSRKLKTIKTEWLEGVDLLDLNNQRKQLLGASKVVMYLPERDYLKIKWKYNTSDFGLIEIKRGQSFAMITPLTGIANH